VLRSRSPLSPSAARPRRRPRRTGTLYLANDGWWQSRIRVDVQNDMAQEATGAPVSVAIGSGAGEADLVGAAAESVRVMDAAGTEMLFEVYGPGGEPVRSGPVLDGGSLTIPAECPAGGTASYYVYYDNPAAWPVPDFFDASPSVRNSSVEAGEGGTPYGWVHDAPDAEHEAIWTTETPHSGAHCLKTTVAPGAQSAWISTRQQNIYIIGGADYTMRAWVKAEGVVGEAGWYIHIGNDSDPMLINHVFGSGGGTHGWTEVTYSFTAPAEADRASLGTVLWGTGVAWFDDVTLECDSPLLLSAAAAAPETIAMAEEGAGAPWHDEDPMDDMEWDLRCPAKLINASSSAIGGLTSAGLRRVLSLADRVDPDSIRVTSDGALIDHFLLGTDVMFQADVAARTARTYYVYASRDDRIGAPPSSDYAGLLHSASNLVQNPSFELGDPTPTGWEGGPPPGVTMGFDTPGLFDSRCVRIDFPDGIDKSWVGRRQDVAVQPGHTYLYSAWVKCENLHDGEVVIYAHYRNALGELCESKQYAGAGAPISGTTDWTLMSGTFEMPADCVTFQLHLTMFARGTVWHDGAVLVEVTPSVAGRLESLADLTASEPTIWPVNALVKVFQDHPPPSRAAAARITAARNEQEPVQIAVRSPDAYEGLRVAVAPPVHSQGGQLDDFEIGVVGYVPIDHRSNYYQSESPTWHRKFPTGGGGCDGWAGLWPDPLLPADTFDLPANTTQPVWVTFSIPPEAAAGDYAGTVRLVQGATTLAELPFTVHVWNFALPDEPGVGAIYDVRFGSYWGEAGKSHDQVHGEVTDLMGANRLCADTIFPAPIINYADGTVTADFTEFDLAAERYFEELNFPYIYTPWYFYLFGWGHPPGTKWGEAPYEGGYPYDTADPSQLRPEYKAAYQACLRAYWDHMKEKGWADHVVLYISDEPWYWDSRIIEQMQALCDMVHEVDPDIPIYSSTWHHIPEWDGYLDVWGIGHYGVVSAEKMAELRAAGNRIYFTTDGHMCTDTPFLAIERLLPHYCFQYDADAYEFWGVSWFTYNPYEFGWPAFIHQSGEPGSYTWTRYPNGDGFLIYPGAPIGHDGPVRSIRLEQAREGVEDHLYLALLRELADAAAAGGAGLPEAEAAFALARELTPSPTANGRYSTEALPDPDKVFEVKEAIGLAIEAARPFPDVGPDHWAREEIARSYPDGTYRPTSPITRDQMAVRVERALCPASCAGRAGGTC
jgi:hypothetical protein